MLPLVVQIDPLFGVGPQRALAPTQRGATAVELGGTDAANCVGLRSNTQE